MPGLGESSGAFDSLSGSKLDFDHIEDEVLLSLIPGLVLCLYGSLLLVGFQAVQYLYQGLPLRSKRALSICAC